MSSLLSTFRHRAFLLTAGLADDVEVQLDALVAGLHLFVDPLDLLLVRQLLVDQGLHRAHLPGLHTARGRRQVRDQLRDRRWLRLSAYERALAERARQKLCLEQGA